MATGRRASAFCLLLFEACRVSAKVAAEAEAERLKADNIVLWNRVRQMMAKEAERLDQINKMHEEMMENAKRQQVRHMTCMVRL